jgi:hypothetical protein
MLVDPTAESVCGCRRLIKTPDRISERPPRGGLSVCAQRSPVWQQLPKLIQLQRRMSAFGKADRIEVSFLSIPASKLESPSTACVFRQHFV